MTDTDARLVAVILAAGYSSRMGAFKPLLPLGKSTLIERAVGCFTEGGVSDVRVVVGHNGAALSAVLQPLGVRTIFNERYAGGMFTSVQAGVASLEPDVKAFFLLPVDTPLVKARTIRILREAYLSARPGDALVFHPRFGQRRGHPPLIAASLVPAIVAWRGDGGLRAVLSRYSEASADVDVADEAILMDVDTPQAYQAAVACADREDLPIVRQ